MNVRKFGVENTDEYWTQRKTDGRTSEGRLHRFLSDLINGMFPGGARILDCGMGEGHVFRLCREKHKTYGIELSDEAIAMYNFPTDTVKQADLKEGIPDFGVKFDVIIASMILHWFNEPSEFLCEAKSKLSEKGFLLVVIPNITFYRFRIAYLFGKFPPISLSHKSFQVPLEAEQMFQKNGLKIEKRLTPRKCIRAKLFPTLFSPDIVYILRPT
jgi:2-polyprenyl-3-methyl-5-hydroxy-6-metoxy-1,4-benzoquinol methylase